MDFYCTLPVPKGTGVGTGTGIGTGGGVGVGSGVGTGTGGLCVGSWKSYHAEIILTGGWTSNSPISVSSSVPFPVSISRIPIILRAYIEL